VTDAEATTLTRVGRLLDDEAELRAEARRLELNPSRSEDARRLFALASRVRTERVELLDRWLTR
jgi:hypothetical protein